MKTKLSDRGIAWLLQAHNEGELFFASLVAGHARYGGKKTELLFSELAKAGYSRSVTARALLRLSKAGLLRYGFSGGRDKIIVYLNVTS